MKSKNKKIEKLRTEFEKTKEKFAYLLTPTGESLNELISEITDYSEIELVATICSNLAEQILLSKNSSEECVLLAESIIRYFDLNKIADEVKNSQVEFYKTLIKTCFRQIYINSDKFELNDCSHTDKYRLISDVQHIGHALQRFINVIGLARTIEYNGQPLSGNENEGLTIEEITTKIMYDTISIDNIIDDSDWGALYCVNKFLQEFKPIKIYITNYRNDPRYVGELSSIFCEQDII